MKKSVSGLTSSSSRRLFHQVKQMRQQEGFGLKALPWVRRLALWRGRLCRFRCRDTVLLFFALTFIFVPLLGTIRGQAQNINWPTYKVGVYVNFFVYEFTDCEWLVSTSKVRSRIPVQDSADFVVNAKREKPATGSRAVGRFYDLDERQTFNGKRRNHRLRQAKRSDEQRKGTIHFPKEHNVEKANFPSDLSLVLVRMCDAISLNRKRQILPDSFSTGLNRTGRQTATTFRLCPYFKSRQSYISRAADKESVGDINKFQNRSI